MPALPSSEVCPGCGAVLAPVSDGGAVHPGASASCARLFEVTLRGLREEAPADAAAATVVRQADDAYDAQHPVAGDPARLRAALDRLGVSLDGTSTVVDRPPGAWRTTIADVAADLDVIDLAVLVESWARSVHHDWSAAASSRT
ncbi:hypothetical protein E4P40_10105 [Blastococcus sp. CT_GayMR20]|uniref:DUF5946 family protein n=1 Tax=Blastococcus sp. CT_GayMR20 TaxID=2559609 RepID=UPI001073D924|nr:DUF5946 family protein [Blastococcus sp. CT_GayMR20]TFV88411.1 hypothetical protein E4P40_10105 [Blastococcus sp. CT_GayMR20]